MSKAPRDIVAGASIDLAKLCHRLVENLRLAELRSLCRALAAEDLQPAANRRAKLLGMIALVTRAKDAGRLSELLEQARQLSPTFAAADVAMNEELWAGPPLPEHIIAVVSAALGQLGRPYNYWTEPDHTNKWTPDMLPTGCVAWPLALPTSDEPLSAQPQAQAALTTVANAIGEERAFAYIGLDRQPAHAADSHVIVVAATANQFDALRIERTAAPSDGIEVGDLIVALNALDRKHGLRLLAATPWAVEFRLMHIAPAQMPAFARWFKRFAPKAYANDPTAFHAKTGGTDPLYMFWD